MAGLRFRNLLWEDTAAESAGPSEDKGAASLTGTASVLLIAPLCSGPLQGLRGKQDKSALMLFGAV